ncbi:MAG: hypothetical protein GY870_01540 [archaeon]|nr:hypothetical protein [archaeon]
MNNIMVNISDFKDPNDTKGRTYREVNNAMKHKFQVGDLVEEDETGVRLFIAKQTRDCDGTPLYCLTPKEDDSEQERENFANSNWVNGVSEESIRFIK